MIRLGNLSGTLMLKDIPLFSFTFEKGMLMDYKLLSNDFKIFPFEFHDGVISERRIKLFWEARITPPTRHFMREKMEEAGLEYYNVEQLILYQKGRCIDDNYWLKTE